MLSVHMKRGGIETSNDRCEECHILRASILKNSDKYGICSDRSGLPQDKRVWLRGGSIPVFGAVAADGKNKVGDRIAPRGGIIEFGLGGREKVGD
ncbi:hypothetical protein NPIL_437091 [Nephila pilipes]|uniref:Uncharacterized protein n=1 Tax=Nephila pilipes TaxID=299642 RepID=A0A8X6UU09_NEPPI|nr:hypothetical protein NPIL_437091 [Nephila pilipes]